MIRFFPEKRKGDDGKLVVKNVPIRMSVTYRGQRVMIYAGHRVDVAKWDAGKQRVKNNTTNATGTSHQDINDRLDRLGTGINKFFTGCEVAEQVPTVRRSKPNWPGWALINSR